MSTELLETFSDEKLKRRKTFILLISGVSIGLFLISLALLISFLNSGKTDTIYSLVPGLVCPMFALIMFPGLKKINEELKRRNS